MALCLRCHPKRTQVRMTSFDNSDSTNTVNVFMAAPGKSMIFQSTWPMTQTLSFSNPQFQVAMDDRKKLRVPGSGNWTTPGFAHSAQQLHAFDKT